jgi:DNA-binding response OmpR family regulator
MKARPVLLVDSDAEWCARICRFLEPHGIGVVVAANLDTAAQMAEAETPRALLMDAATRHQSGSAVAALRDDIPNVPVGYLKKSAALDALLLMLAPSAPGARQHRAA